VNSHQERSEKLYCRTGSSNKFYNANLIQSESNPNNWHVVCYYGKVRGWGVRGSIGGNKTIKCENAPFDEAEHIFNKLIASKKKKGYESEG